MELEPHDGVVADDERARERERQRKRERERSDFEEVGEGER